MASILLKNKKGFTLTEVIIVVVILGLLTAIGIPTYKAVKIQAERRIVETNLRMIDEAIILYYTIHPEKMDGKEFLSMSMLIPDYIKSEIKGPGETYYTTSHSYYYNDENWKYPYRAHVYNWNMNELIGGYDLYPYKFYCLSNLPWKNEK